MLIPLSLTTWTLLGSLVLLMSLSCLLHSTWGSGSPPTCQILFYQTKAKGTEERHCPQGFLGFKVKEFCIFLVPTIILILLCVSETWDWVKIFSHWLEWLCWSNIIVTDQSGAVLVVGSSHLLCKCWHWHIISRTNDEFEWRTNH